MSYSSGTYTTPITLLQALGTWLGGLSGWTVDASASDGSGWRLHAHKGSMYVHMRAAVNESVWAAGGTGYSLNLYVGTSAYSSGAAWNAQGGGPIPSGQSWNVGVGITLPNGGAGVTYDFFDDGSADNIRIVVQHTAGVFGHLGFGSTLAKAGTWGGTNGGLYFFGSKGSHYAHAYNGSEPGSGLTAPPPGAYSDMQAAANIFVLAGATGFDSYTGWMSACQTAQVSDGQMPKILRTGIPGYYGSWPQCPRVDIVQPRLTQALTNRQILHPPRIFADRSAGGVSRIGNLPNVYLTNATSKGQAMRSTFTVGAATYMLFPNFAVLKV